MEEVTIEEANAEVARLVEEAKALIAEAELIADRYNLSFSFDLAYGMGGWYEGSGGEWVSSTSSCY